MASALAALDRAAGCDGERLLRRFERVEEPPGPVAPGAAERRVAYRRDGGGPAEGVCERLLEPRLAVEGAL